MTLSTVIHIVKEKRKQHSELVSEKHALFGIAAGKSALEISTWSSSNSSTVLTHFSQGIRTWSSQVATLFFLNKTSHLL